MTIFDWSNRMFSLKKNGLKNPSISLDPEYRPVCGKSDAIHQRRRYLPPSGQSEWANRPDTKSFSFVQAPFNQFGLASLVASYFNFRELSALALLWRNFCMGLDEILLFFRFPNLTIRAPKKYVWRIIIAVTLSTTNYP